MTAVTAACPKTPSILDPHPLLWPGQIFANMWHWKSARHICFCLQLIFYEEMTSAGAASVHTPPSGQPSSWLTSYARYANCSLKILATPGSYLRVQLHDSELEQGYDFLKVYRYNPLLPDYLQHNASSPVMVLTGMLNTTAYIPVGSAGELR